MIIPMLCVTIFVILVVWFLLPRVARLMIHTPTAISIFVCLSMVQLRSEERFSRNAETDIVCRLVLENKKPPNVGSDAPAMVMLAQLEGRAVSRRPGSGGNDSIGQTPGGRRRGAGGSEEHAWSGNCTR